MTVYVIAVSPADALRQLAANHFTHVRERAERSLAEFVSTDPNVPPRVYSITIEETIR